ncbi:MAG: hypothetical protein O2955_04050 [Planctomycetota bacterium]|nr:hypothetical protein [Planctomycetota bacterium]MDA1211662.1 hypothetical protein [Planctomycetota bacterium]
MVPVCHYAIEPRRVLLGCALMVLTICGCPEEKAETVAVPDPVPIQTTPTAAPPSPYFIEINVGKPVKTTDCQAQLLTFSGERSSVLMVKSYPDTQQETLPSAMLQAHVSARDPASLIGTTVKAEVYLMTANETGAASSRSGNTEGALSGVTWHTPPGELADVKITAVENQQITGEIVSGELINTMTTQRAPLKGRFTGLLQ